MKKNQNLITIRGSKGKGGGGSTFEADDNMFARQSAAFVDAISEGPIKGLVYGDGSILVDEVRLRNVDQTTGHVSSTTNFNNFTVITKNGEATQVVDADFFAEYPSAATIKDVSSAELLEGEPQYFTISSGTFEKREADYIKITVSTTGMSAITKKGDNKGDINETEVHFTIDFNWVDNSGTHHTQEMFDTGFQGKVSGKYAHTFGFNIEEIKRTYSINDWSVKVTKLGTSPDSSSQTEVQNAIYVDSIEASIADKLEYPYTAYVGGVIDAEAFNSVPARGYEIDGKLIQIPTNHYPCDYNGRKLVCSDASSFAVGDVISQTLSISSLTASGDAEEGYTATATLGSAHGVAQGETFRVTIATNVTQDEDFYEGLFVATATTSTAFTYTLNKPFDESLNSGAGGYKTLTSTTCGGAKTAALFSGGLVDKKVSNTLYLRNVAAQDSAITGTITNGDGDSTTVTSASQVFIPANYRRIKSTEKPGTAEQDWDGTYYQSWCNNPAWVYNDLITNKIYGLGNYITQEQVNKWEIFQIGRYCDELVPAGVQAADLLSLHCTDDTNYIPSGSSGMHEPRFSANLVLQGKAEAFKVLNDVTSIFRGMAYWLNGESYLVQDSEKDPVYQFTNANVLNGEFKYEGTANKTRTNSILVEWNNPQDYYRARTEIVELEETLQKETEFVKPESTRAFGCTSRGQARRLGKWKLLTNNWNTNTVTFETSLNAAFLRPGDIIQVIDQHKEGKSWGGRISTSSSTTAINIDRAFAIESGYLAGDYRLTCSFVNYRAILAQDQATIGGTAFVRGDHLTSITTEEAALTLQDDSGDLVFVQWTPFTFTETQFVSSVTNAGKTINVASAFNSAPSSDQIWIISRAALSTGKTKQEAKLFRMMAMLESDKNKYEITALEYNPSKFDAVDKNEAFTQYREIFLPDSFKAVPAVENIEVEPRIKAAGTGGTINSLVVDWDPATNSDGSLYNSVRHYEVEYSKDNKRWFKAGTNTNTEYEIMDNADVSILSGNYYFKIYTVSLNGVRSPVAESGLEVIDFNRAVGPAEGSVGTDTHYINFIGNISGDFTLESGKVTFSPTNIFHNDGVNEHAVNSQSQLDFTGLDHTSGTGGDEGYVFFDHSASQFKAIAFDETSGQFYPVGSNVFATATGTLTASTSTTPRKWTGLDSTNFDGELAVGNVFKYTKGSNTRYHRVKKLESDSVLRTFNPTRDTIVNSDNQAFSKPTFLVDYKNDTIMGKVTKTGASTYTLQKFGSVQGESGYAVEGTNQNFTFDSNLDGTVTNESAYTCDFTVKRGSQAYSFANSGTTQNTFGISLQARTGFDNDSDVVIDSSTGQITIGDGDMDAITTATATVRLFDRGRANLLIADKILSFSKSAQGSAGEDAKIVVVTPDSQMMTKETFPEDYGATVTFFYPNSITVTAHCSNTTQNGTWSVSGGSATTNNTITNGKATATVSSAQIVDDMTLTYTLHADDGGASDTTQLHIVELFEGSVQPIFDNIAHVFPASKDGVVGDYTGSGGTIKMYQGTSLLDYDGVGTTAGHWKVVVNNDSNITEGAISSTGSSGSRFATVADHSGMADGTDKIILTYTITGKDTRGTAFTFAVTQTLTKSKTGADGSPGAAGVNTAIVPLYRKSTSGSSAPASFSGTFTYTFATGAVTGGTLNSWTTSPPSITNGEYIWVRQATASSASATDTIPTSEFSTAVVHSGVGEDGSSITGAAGNSNAVAYLYRVSTSNSSAPTSFSGTFTYTFATNLLSGGTFNSWTQSIPTVPKGQYLWVRQATASSNTATDTIAISEWSAAVVSSASGADGDPGADGSNAAVVYYGKTGAARFTTAPTKPSGEITSTSTSNNVWTRSSLSHSSTVTVWQSNGTDASGSWVWSTPFIYFDKSSITDLFDNEYSFDFTNLSTSIVNGIGFTPMNITGANIGSNASTFRGNIGAGTSNFSGVYADLSSKPSLFSGSAADLTGNISTARFDSSDFPRLAAITSSSAATARAAIGAGTSSFSGSYADLSNISILDVHLAGAATITKEADFEFSSITVSSGAQASSFNTTDGSNYTANNTTGTITVDHPLDSVASQSCTYTWTRDGDNIRANTGSGTEGFALTNTGSGADAWSFSPATFTAATTKTITVTHTQSGLTIDMTCYIIDTSSSGGGGGGGGGGGCFLPGTLVDLEEGQQVIESLEVGQKIKGGTVTKKESFEVDYWYKLNDIQLTAGHPVWIEDKGWCCIDPEEYYKEHVEFGHRIELQPQEIEVGDMTTAGEVERIELMDIKRTVWNITVDNEHTYYVDGMLVHNSKQ
tara:strand:- start:1866 stop:8756 length:6891 start_codon:yes stop_codon:yes gene_type:complete